MEGNDPKKVNTSRAYRKQLATRNGEDTPYLSKTFTIIEYLFRERFTRCKKILDQGDCICLASSGST